MKNSDNISTTLKLFLLALIISKHVACWHLLFMVKVSKNIVSAILGSTSTSHFLVYKFTKKGLFLTHVSLIILSNLSEQMFLKNLLAIAFGKWKLIRWSYPLILDLGWMPLVLKSRIGATLYDFSNHAIKIKLI